MRRNRPPMLYGYARVSSTDQDTRVQVSMLRAAGCEVICEGQRSGSTRDGRTELPILMYLLRKVDQLLVIRIDCLARSIGDLKDIVRTLKAKGVALKTTEQPIDTSTADGKAFLDMLGSVVEFATMRQIAKRFRCILRTGDVTALRRWLDDAHRCGIHAMQRFARTLQRDLDAVQNALTTD